MVVSPTVAAVGLSFYSYGFPQMGACLEIGIVQILLVIMFSLVGSLPLFAFLPVVYLLFIFDFVEDWHKNILQLSFSTSAKYLFWAIAYF